MPSDELPLFTLAEQLLSGESSQRKVLEQVASWRSQLAGKDAREKLFYSVLVVTQELLPTLHNMSALDLGEVLRAAARLLHEEVEAYVAMRAGRHFLWSLDSATTALPWLDFARRHIGPEYDAQAWFTWLCALHLTGNHDDVQQHLDRALELGREREDRWTEVALLELRARHLAHRRESEAALGALDEALERRQLLRDPKPFNTPVPSEIELWGRRGMIARDGGHLEKAVRSFEHARELATLGGAEWIEAFMTSEIGVTWQLAGSDERAGKILRQAARQADALGDSRAALRWGGWIQGPLDRASFRSSDLLANAQRMLRQQDPNHEAVDEALTATLAAARREKLPEVEAMAYNLRGILYIHRGFTHRAWVAFEEALQLAEQVGARHIALGIRINLCLGLVEGRKLGRAQELLEEAIDYGERLRSDAESTELRKALSGRLLVTFDMLISLLALGWADRSGSIRQPPEPRRVLELSQRSRAINLGGWLALGNILNGESAPELKHSIREFRSSEILLERAAAAGDPLSRLIERVGHRRRALGAALDASGRSLKALLVPTSTVEATLDTLDEGEFLLDLFAAEHRVIFTVVEAGGAAHCGEIPWTRDERLDFLDRWSVALALAQVATSKRGGHWRFDSDPLRSEALVRARGGTAASLDLLLNELDARFFRPLSEQVGAGTFNSFWISPHLELFALPFWPLSNRLGTAYSIVPNTSALPLLAARSFGHSGHRYKIGDVTGSLPFADLELDHLEGYEALPARLNSLIDRLRDAEAVHFAGHGQFDSLRPYDSGVMVESDLADGLDPEIFVTAPWSESRKFRRLTVTGVMTHLELEACHLVVLSACCTGLPEVHRAGEITGLPAAFLVAGARTVIASLWPTHDAATSLLMQELYDRLENGERPSHALCAASAALASIERKEATRRLGDPAVLPPGERPFAAPTYTMAFQCYGAG